MSEKKWVVWTSALSPFGLKTILLCRHAGLNFRVLPGAGSFFENWRYHLRRARLVAGKLPLKAPQMSEEDEFPLVPYLFGPEGENLYDSTAIAGWLNQRLAANERVIPDDPAVAFVVRLIDDYADEFGLYMVHHMRWKMSAADNRAGEVVAHEFRSIYGPLEFMTARIFRQRQTRRLPYLFSVAPEGYRTENSRTPVDPPALPGFGATHELIESAWFRLLHILDVLLSGRPFVLGSRFTLADAALYGQLAMNLDVDPGAETMLKVCAPALHGWLRRLHQGELPEPEQSSHFQIDASISPLLAEICRIHVPLMQQNYTAYEDFRQQGQTVFNEAAFNKRQALYDGQLDGHPYRHVAKSFQAKVWKNSVAAWNGLTASEQKKLELLLPPGHGLDGLRHKRSGD